jgi:hypothetical protein
MGGRKLPPRANREPKTKKTGHASGFCRTPDKRARSTLGLQGTIFHCAISSRQGKPKGRRNEAARKNRLGASWARGGTQTRGQKAASSRKAVSSAHCSAFSWEVTVPQRLWPSRINAAIWIGISIAHRRIARPRVIDAAFPNIAHAPQHAAAVVARRHQCSASHRNAHYVWGA